MEKVYVEKIADEDDAFIRIKTDDEKVSVENSFVCLVYGGQIISAEFIAELINNWIDNQESDGNKEES